MMLLSYIYNIKIEHHFYLAIPVFLKTEYKWCAKLTT